MYDYGPERQGRAKILVRAFRKDPGKVIHKGLTGAQLADAIENGTQDGHEIVAISGLVFFARQALRSSKEGSDDDGK